MITKCLVLDDQNRYVKKITDKVIESAPMEVIGYEAKNKVLNYEVDQKFSYVLICDIVLSRYNNKNKDGLKVIAKFREMVPNSLIIGVSNISNFNREAIKAGANYFFDKSVFDDGLGEINNLILDFDILNRVYKNLGIKSSTKVFEINNKHWIKSYVISRNDEQNLVNLFCQSENKAFFKSYPIDKLKIDKKNLQPGNSINIFMAEANSMNMFFADVSSNEDHSKYYDKSKKYISEYTNLDIKLSDLKNSSLILKK